MPLFAGKVIYDIGFYAPAVMAIEDVLAKIARQGINYAQLPDPDTCY